MEIENGNVKYVMNAITQRGATFLRPVSFYYRNCCHRCYLRITSYIFT